MLDLQCSSVVPLIYLYDILMVLGTSTFSVPTVLNSRWHRLNTHFSHVVCITFKNFPTP